MAPKTGAEPGKEAKPGPRPLCVSAHPRNRVPFLCVSMWAWPVGLRACVCVCLYQISPVSKCLSKCSMGLFPLSFTFFAKEGRA